MKIELAGGQGAFSLDELTKYIRGSGRQHIVIGKQKSTYDNHTKPQSLDFWARQYAKNKNGFVVTERVIGDLLATGKFELAIEPCPDSGRKCRSLRLL